MKDFLKSPPLIAIVIALVIMFIPLTLTSLMFYHMMLGVVSITVETPVRPAIQYDEYANGREFWQLEIAPPPHELTVAIPDQIVREAQEADIEAWVRVTFTCSHCEHSEVETFYPPFDEDYTLICNCWTNRFRQKLTVHFVTGSHAYYAGPTSDYKEPDSIVDFDYQSIMWHDLSFYEDTGRLYHDSGMSFGLQTSGYCFTAPVDDERKVNIASKVPDTAPNNGVFKLNITGGKLLAVAYRADRQDTKWENDYMVSQETMSIDLRLLHDYGYNPYSSCSLLFFVSDDQGQCYLLPITLSEDMVAAANR